MIGRRGIGRARLGLGMFGLAILVGCNSDELVLVGDTPAPPENFDGFYYGRAVHLSWELGTGWSEEPFRVWGRRVSDAEFFFIAEVTNCADGLCTYTDANVAPDVTYVYYVSAVSASGVEAASDNRVEVRVPQPIPPPIPEAPDAVPLDAAVFLVWDESSRAAEDFSFYRVYIESADGSAFLLGETDSEGFLDLLVENGNTYGYFVTAVDDLGHESDGSVLAEGTPRPDFQAELLYAFEDRPDLAGFRFQESESTSPIRDGADPERHFRLEADGAGWWLVPGAGVQVAEDSFFTTALRCGPAADAGCTDVRWVPESGYGSATVQLLTEYTYVLRVASGGGWRYGAIRPSHLGFAQDGAIAIFDWAYQLQVDNPSLTPAR